MSVLTGAKAVALEAAASQFDVVMCVETGRDCYELTDFVCLDGLARGNRSHVGAGRGQGMAVWVRQSLSTFVSVEIRSDYYMWLRVALPGCQAFSICCAYFPPQSSTTEWSTASAWMEAFVQFRTDLLVMQSLGEVAVFGDFNAHTGTADDTGAVSQQVLDAMGVPAWPSPASQQAAAPCRLNPDARVVCAFGQSLLNVCAATGCMLLNGRDVSDGVLRAAATSHPACRRTFRSWRSNAASSVIDYCLISSGFVSRVSYFQVGEFVQWSDHAPLECGICPAPAAAVKGGSERAVPSAEVICWDASEAKRAQYLTLLRSPAMQQQRQQVLQQLQEGKPLAEVCTAWCDLLQRAARSVYGVLGSGGGGRRLPDGRPVKAWFKACKPNFGCCVTPSGVGTPMQGLLL